MPPRTVLFVGYPPSSKATRVVFQRQTFYGKTIKDKDVRYVRKDKCFPCGWSPFAVILESMPVDGP